MKTLMAVLVLVVVGCGGPELEPAPAPIPDAGPTCQGTGNKRCSTDADCCPGLVCGYAPYSIKTCRPESP